MQALGDFGVELLQVAREDLNKCVGDVLVRVAIAQKQLWNLAEETPGLHTLGGIVGFAHCTNRHDEKNTKVLLKKTVASELVDLANLLGEEFRRVSQMSVKFQVQDLVLVELLCDESLST